MRPDTDIPEDDESDGFAGFVPDSATFLLILFFIACLGGAVWLLLP